MCVLALVAGAGCSGGTSNPAPHGAAAALPSSPKAKRSRTIKPQTRAHETSTQRLLGKIAPSATPAVSPEAPIPVLDYSGGPMLESVQAYAIFWGSNVDAATVTNIPAFLGDITSDKPYMQQLAQYNINGLTIGSGTFAGSYVDSGAPATTTVTDALIQQELSRLIDTGAIPANNGHNIYMVYFPPGVTISSPSGAQSCQAFCAYHGNYTSNDANVFYGVMPDLASNGCNQGCGSNGSALLNLYSASSHELIEAITDAAVGTGDLAWYDFTTNQGEIGDICFEFDGKQDGFVVQTEWLNHEQGCGIVGSTETGHLSVTPSVAIGNTGGSGLLTVELSGDVTGDLTPGSTFAHLVGTAGSVAFLDATGTTPITSIKVGDSVKAKVTLNAGAYPAGNYGFKITATDHNGIVHLALVNLAIVGPTPTITSFTPTSGPTSGNTTVAITGTKFVNGAAVTFDGIPAATTFVSATRLNARTPSHAAGAVAVKVFNPNVAPVTAATQFTYNGTGVTPPTVTSITPSAGPVGGGQLVTIKGTKFSPNAVLVIGGNQISDPNLYVIDNATQARAITPAHAAGPVDVQVVNVETFDAGGMAHGQTGTLANGYTYGGNVAPTITALSPNTGPSLGGTYVTLTGANFVTGATVTLGGTAATVKSVHPSFIGLVTPPHAPGAVAVVVTNPSGLSATLNNGFTYVASPAPTIATIVPASGPIAGGTSVTISGTNFATPNVTFGGTTAAVTGSSATSITVTTPAHAAGAVDVVVTNADGQKATQAAGFTYQVPPPPTIAIINPAMGPTTGGTTVSITGTNFANPTVTFGGSAGAVSASSSTSITVTTPAHAVGPVDVVVTDGDGQTVTSAGGFTYTAVVPPPPAITQIDPASGPTTGGTAVTIAGSNFSSPTVTFDGTSATVTASTAASITVTTPAHAAGAVDVVVANGDGQKATAAAGFTYTVVHAPPPAITHIDPISGPTTGGTTVTITGTNFVSSPAVTIGGSAATVTGASSTSIMVTTPAHAAGAVDVVVTNPDTQAATATGGFTFVEPPPPPDMSSTDMAMSSTDMAVSVKDMATAPDDDMAAAPDLAQGGTGGNGPGGHGGGCSCTIAGHGTGGGGSLLAMLLIAGALWLRRRGALPL